MATVFNPLFQLIVRLLAILGHVFLHVTQPARQSRTLSTVADLTHCKADLITENALFIHKLRRFLDLNLLKPFRREIKLIAPKFNRIFCPAHFRIGNMHLLVSRIAQSSVDDAWRPIRESHSLGRLYSLIVQTAPGSKGISHGLTCLMATIAVTQGFDNNFPSQRL